VMSDWVGNGGLNRYSCFVVCSVTAGGLLFCCVLCDSWGFVVSVFVYMLVFKTFCIVCQFVLGCVCFKPPAVSQPLSSITYYLFPLNTSLLHLAFSPPTLYHHYIHALYFPSHPPTAQPPSSANNKPHFLTVQSDP
jgi:hypothetical protein